MIVQVKLKGYKNWRFSTNIDLALFRKRYGCSYNIKCDLSNGAISNDLERAWVT